MPYVRIWVHLVWSTKCNERSMTSELRPILFDHLRSNARKKDILLDTLDGYLDHVHALIRLGGDQTIAKVAQLLKGESSHWVNDEKLTGTPFQWQDEYCALSVSESGVEAVRRYIERQEEHHRKKSFAEEYAAFRRGVDPSEGGLKPH